MGKIYCIQISKQPHFLARNFYGWGNGWNGKLLKRFAKRSKDYCGKEVAQAYVSAPYGKLDKEYQSLVAFAKTKELNPAQSETLHMSFDMTEVASYDEERASEAILLAKDFRKNGKVTELVKRRQEVSLDEYKTLAKKNYCISMMYMKASNDIEMTNLATGTSKIIKSKIK